MMTRKRDRGERGAVLVEFMFVFPIFVLLIFGGLDLAFAVDGVSTYHAGVQEGVALIQNGDTVAASDPCVTTMLGNFPTLDAQTAESLCEVTNAVGSPAGLDATSLELAIACETSNGAVVDCTSTTPQPSSFVVCARVHPQALTGFLAGALDGNSVGFTAYGAVYGSTDNPPQAPLFSSFNSTTNDTHPMACPPTSLYAVTYTNTTSDAEMASGTPPTDNPYQPGSTATVKGAGSLSLTGYTFAGWCTTNTAANPTACTGTSYQPGDTFTINADVNLYSMWDPDVTYSKMASDQEPTSGTPPQDTNNPYTPGSNVTVLGGGSLSLAGYTTFVGWCTTDDATDPTMCSGTLYHQGDTFAINTAAVTLYSVWSP